MTTIIFAILALVFLGLYIALLFKSDRLEKLVADRDAEIAGTKQESERIRQHYESEAARIDREAQAALGNAQEFVNQQLAALGQESERVRQHYESEARRVQAELEPLRRFEGLRDAEVETQRILAEAVNEATALRKEAQALLEQARIAGADERNQAHEMATSLREQADALLNQATRDAGRIMAEAEKRAEQIGGDAYRALREKEQLEQAVVAMRNAVEGYGDRYLVPTYSLLDELPGEFGSAAAGEALKSARDLSQRMVLQGEAATCDYAEANRRKTALNFVTFAFNGLVDTILSRIRKEDPGTLKQEIVDAYSTVNLNGQAFRNARILPAYLDARLAELKWAGVVQEMVRQRQEDERHERERRRDEDMARREAERKIQEAKTEEDRVRKAREQVQDEHERALAELSARLEKASQEQRVELVKAIEEQKAKFDFQLKGKDEEIRLAEEKSQRAIANAQKTKHGHVYIISNIGSFDSDVFKIGLTRRDEWQDRIDELYDASVPFDFDVHGIIESDDAPALEYKLHQLFLRKRVNKLNPHKEHFRLSFAEIRQEVEKLKQGEDYIAIKRELKEEAAATEWRRCQMIDDDPQELQKWLNEQAKSQTRRSRHNNLPGFDDVLAKR